MLKCMQLKANEDVLNYLLFDWSYINEMTKEIVGDVSQCTLVSQKSSGLF